MKKTIPALALAALWAVSISMTACGSIGEELPQSSAISQCGGFEVNQQSQALNGSGDDNFDPSSSYCDAEVLDWSYDAALGKLALSNNRVLLNCCGNHSIEATDEEGVLVIREIDAPEFDDARCGCMCVFDFAIELEQVAMGTIQLRLMRDVTDDDQAEQEVLVGEIDLAKGSGSVVVDSTDVEFWCGQPE
jgi:hypothetical protein